MKGNKTWMFTRVFSDVFRLLDAKTRTKKRRLRGVQANLCVGEPSWQMEILGLLGLKLEVDFARL